MSNQNDEKRKQIEQEARKFGSSAMFNNLLWWADKEKKQGNQKTLDKALEILDDVILTEYRDDFVINVAKEDIFYRARTVSISDYGNIDKGIRSSETRLYGYDWNESKEPPAKFAAANRNSKKQEQALYLASNEITACAEVRPPIRALVSIAKFKANKDMKILDFSKMHYSKPLNLKDDEYGIDTRKYLSKVLSLFSTPVYDKDEYKTTQMIVAHFREKGYCGFKYKSFYADGFNFTFFDEYLKNFRWIDSRVVLNYASSNLFISLDRENTVGDIDNLSNVQEEITADVKNKLWEDIKKAWQFSLPLDELKIANTMHESIIAGEHLTQEQLAKKEETTRTKVQKVQGKLKKAGIIKYVGRGKNGYWEWIS